jgi:hypothetical protein
MIVYMRKPEEIINSFPENWEEAQIVYGQYIEALQRSMASNDHNELELYIMRLQRIMPLLHECLSLRHIEIRRAEREVSPMVVYNVAEMDPDMEITRVDVPRSNPSWPAPSAVQGN